MNKKTKILSKMSDDMALFGKITMPNMFSSNIAPFHHDLYEMFQNNDLKKICIQAPRHHAKSSIGACVFPIHHLVFGEGPKLILLCSKTLGHSIRLLDTIKNVLEYSMPFRALFGYWGQHSAKAWTKTDIVLKDGSLITTRGTGQQVIGLKHGDQRPTLVIVDDPEDMNNTKTAEAMDMNLKWLLTQLLPGMDAKKGRIVIIGTPQHQRCIVETLPSMSGWLCKKYKALQDDGKSSLWKEMWPADKLKAEKADLESIGKVSMFYREYQCEIVGDEDQLFKSEDIQYYDGRIELNDEKEPVLHLKEPFEAELPVHTFMGVDPASSTRQTADYSAIVPIAIDRDDNRYILPYYRKRVKPMDLADAVMVWFNRFRPQKTKIETVGYQEMLRDYLRRKCEDMNIFIPGLEVKNSPRMPKSVRLEGLQPPFCRKKVFIRKDMSELEDELLMYPRGKHDDLLDGLYYAMKGCYKPHAPSHDNTTSQKDKRGTFSDFDWMTL